MERAARVIGKLRSGLTEEELAIGGWPLAVGKRLARRTSAVALVRDRLVIEVEDAVWQRQLFTMRNQILGQIESAIGRKLVLELEFRIAVPRREPARAEVSRADSGRDADEANGIVDPLFRTIYVAARKKASA